MIFSTKKVPEPGTYKYTSRGNIQEHTNKDEKLSPCSNCENIKWEKLI